MKRVKRRYLALQVDSDATPNGREFIDAVWNSVTRLYGEYGASLTGLALIDYNLERKTAILRCSLVSLGLVRVSIAAITSVANSEAAVHVLAVSGTIKALCKKTRQLRTS